MVEDRGADVDAGVPAGDAADARTVENDDPDAADTTHTAEDNHDADGDDGGGVRDNTADDAGAGEDTDDVDDAETSIFSRDVRLLLTVVVVGIVTTGIVRRGLGVAGYNSLGRWVFLLGYGGMVLIVWYGWIRPLDITGPD